MENLKVSIIVPVYNVEEILHQCVDSILSQTHKNIEVILVNDGSKDKSGEICDTYANNHINVKAIHRENGGQSAARNSGLKLVTGDYVSFIDSDDWIRPDMIQVMLSTLLEYKTEVVECDLAYARSLDSYDISEPYDKSSEVLLETNVETLSRIIENQRFSVCVRMYKRSLIEGFSFVEGKNAPDVYFSSQVFSKTDKNVYIKYPFYIYYYNLDSITKKPYTLKKLDSLDAALFLEDKIKSFSKDANLLALVRKNLLTILYYHYRFLNYYPKLDQDKEITKRMKRMINENYDSGDKNGLGMKLARYLPIPLFNLLISANKIRRSDAIR